MERWRRGRRHAQPGLAGLTTPAQLDLMALPTGRRMPMAETANYTFARRRTPGPEFISRTPILTRSLLVEAEQLRRRHLARPREVTPRLNR
jgi:hypothetical protein